VGGLPSLGDPQVPLGELPRRGRPVYLSEEPRAARPLLDDLRPAGFAASTAIQCARIDLLTGGLSTAEQELRRAWDTSASIGENYLLPSLVALLAEVVSAQGRLDEAEELSRAAEELAPSDAAALQALWPSLRGEVLAWQDRAHVAERRAREALDLIRIRAALSRLTAAYSQYTSTDGDRSASDRRAWNSGGRGAHVITEKLDEHAEHIVEVFLNAIEAERLDIDNEGGVHIAPTHGVRLHAAIAAIEQAYGRPPQAPACRADR
jgi:tetratricopeptide (TPR) repeat protein